MTRVSFAAAGPAGIEVEMIGLLARVFATSDFPPRWHCGNWSPLHAWVHIVSDLAIFGAYLAIPCVLAVFAIRRRDVPFSSVFLLFGAFILSCGFGHLVEATLFWHPWYRLSGLLKAITAVVSWATVVALIPIVPRVIALPGKLALNAHLEAEIAERQRAEERLRQNLETLERTNQDLNRFSRSIIGREERVMELKREVNALLRELGQPGRYRAGPDDVSRPANP